MVEINEFVSIPEEELRFTASRSGGPGGQNVNKVNTRITLVFDLDNTTRLDDAQKARVRRRLGGRISKDGLLRVVSQDHRTQSANRRAAVQRFVRMLASALKKRRPRRETKVPQRAIRRRIEEKVRRGRIKRLRSKPPRPDD